MEIGNVEFEVVDSPGLGENENVVWVPGYEGEEENKSVTIEFVDGQIVNFLASKQMSDHAMMSAIAKILALLHHKANQCHEQSKKIENILLKVELSNVVKSYNGYAYVLCQFLAGGINIGGAMLSASPTTAKKLAGGLFEVLRSDLSNQNTVLKVSRLMAKQTQNWSQPCTILGSIFDNSAQSSRNFAQAYQKIHETSVGNLTQYQQKENDKTQQQLQTIQRVQEQKQQIVKSMCG